MELRPFRALRGSPRFKERRPGLWIDRQVFGKGDGTLVLPLLVGLVRVGESAGVAISGEDPAPETISKRVGELVSMKTDAEPCLLLTRAPLAASLATTRRPDFTLAAVEGASGTRHDFFRINDYAQHVELQGLVKNAEAELLSGRGLWDAARQFSASPAAAKLPGAKFKLCAIADERLLKYTPVRPEPPVGVLAFSFEDPVY
jgi:hypothetical protein